jgi:cardiolipin synthase
MLLTIPNLLTLLRLLLTPLVIWAVCGGRHSLALGVFAAAAATDVLDGALARRFHSVTRVGAYLDPVADKVLLSGVYLTLAAVGMLPWWFVGLVFGRDLVILASSAAVLLFSRLRNFPPSVWGKLSTFFQALTAVVWMSRNVLPYPPVDALARALIWPTALATLWSGLHYGWRLTRNRHGVTLKLNGVGP